MTQSNQACRRNPGWPRLGEVRRQGQSQDLPRSRQWLPEPEPAQDHLALPLHQRPGRRPAQRADDTCTRGHPARNTPLQLRDGDGDRIRGAYVTAARDPAPGPGITWTPLDADAMREFITSQACSLLAAIIRTRYARLAQPHIPLGPATPTEAP
jgi:hypothetical protein